ncbi:MAG: AMP-binding protein [Pseudomonadales bacterium]
MAEISLSRIVAHWAAQQGPQIALVHDDTRLSWDDLERRSNRLARAYAALGVGHNDFVTIALPNGVEFFEACIATWKLGATPQPVSARLPAFEREQIIELANPALVVGIEPIANDKRATLPQGHVPSAALDDGPVPEITAESFKAMTSGGSTGRPKLIVSKQPAVTDPDVPALNMQLSGSVLIPGPLYHNGPFVWAMAALFKGNKITMTTRFDAEQTLALIDTEAVDTVYMVPTMMQRIWNLPEPVRQRYSLQSLQTLWHLAAPCPAWLKEAYIDWLGASVIWELYGGTEGQGRTIISGEEWLGHRGSVGRPAAGCEMKIVDEHGDTLPPGEIGELFMRPETGPGSTYRYVGAEAKALPGGWESLGDLGHMDADGYLYLSDRLTDMIVSGGANIYPAEVEAAIEACPGVRSTAVIGLPDDDLGSRIHALVDAPGSDLDAARLLEFLRTRIVTYKLPRSVEFVDAPLRDDAGKVRRKDLRAARLPS